MKNFYFTEFRLRARGRTRGGHNRNDARRAGPWAIVTAIPEMSGRDPRLIRTCIALRGYHDNCEYRIVRFARAEILRVKP